MEPSGWFGMLWVLLDGVGPLLLEEPELSLHAGVVRHIPPMMARLGRKTGRQIILSTHSYDLLSDEGIASEEVGWFSHRRRARPFSPRRMTIRFGLCSRVG